MAWQRDETIALAYIFRDDDAARGTHTVYVPLAVVGSADLFGVATNYAALLQAVSTCVIEKFIIRHGAYDETYPQPVMGSHHERRCVLLCATATDERYVLSVPGLRSTVLAATGPYVGVGLDLTNPQVQALRAAIRDGIGGLHLYTPWGVQLSDLLAGYFGYEVERP